MIVFTDGGNNVPPEPPGPRAAAIAAGTVVMSVGIGGAAALGLASDPSLELSVRCGDGSGADVCAYRVCVCCSSFTDLGDAAISNVLDKACIPVRRRRRRRLRRRVYVSSFPFCFF